MRNVRRVLQVSRLSPQARHRLIQCLTARAVPKPIWQQIHAPNDRSKILLFAGICALIVLALIGGDSYQSPLWIVAWFVSTTLAAWGLLAGVKARKDAAAFSVPEGSYLFATDLIEIQDGVCSIFDLEEIVEIRPKPNHMPGKAGTWDIEFVLPGQTIRRPIAGKQLADRVVRDFWAAKENHLAAVSSADWNAVSALDPLFEARYGGAWEQLRIFPVAGEPVPGTSSTGLLGLRPAIIRNGLLVGCALGAALWFGNNLVRDQIAFGRARSADTVLGWQRYLARENPRSSEQVRATYLPAAALKEAKRAGTASALQEFLKKYGTSTVAGDARALLHREFEAARTRVRQELNPDAAEAMVALLNWQEEHRVSAVDVRFSASSDKVVSGFDDIIAYIQRMVGSRRAGVSFPPIATAFTPATVRQKEDEIVSLFRRGLSTVVPQTLLLPQRGGGFAGMVSAFDEPAFAVEWAANPPIDEGMPMVPILDLDHDAIYVPLRFDCTVSLAVPKQKPYSFKFSFLPGDYIPESYSGGSYYDRMVAIAFEELNARIAGAFFPKQEVKKSFSDKRITRANSLNGRRMLPTTPRKISATGFLITNTGFIATAKHFTEGAHDFKIITPQDTYEAELVKEDPKHDIAILRLSPKVTNWKKLPVIPLRSSGSVKPREKVWTSGYPNPEIQGRSPKPTEGIITSTLGLRDDPSEFQHSVPIEHGNSGGALLDDYGNAIGVVVSNLRGTLSGVVNMAVKSDELIKLLDSIPNHGDRPPPYPPRDDQKATLNERATLGSFQLEALQ